MRGRLGSLMDFGTTGGPAIREALGGAIAGGLLTCYSCGQTTRNSVERCRFCLAPFAVASAPVSGSRKATKPAAGATPRAGELEAILGELEALAQEQRAPWRHCNACGRLTHEGAVRCECGALCEDERETSGFECSRCGAPVSIHTTSCTCGAQFFE